MNADGRLLGNYQADPGPGVSGHRSFAPRRWIPYQGAGDRAGLLIQSINIYRRSNADVVINPEPRR